MFFHCGVSGMIIKEGKDDKIPRSSQMGKKNLYP